MLKQKLELAKSFILAIKGGNAKQTAGKPAASKDTSRNPGGRHTVEQG